MSESDVLLERVREKMAKGPDPEQAEGQKRKRLEDEQTAETLRQLISSAEWKVFEELALVYQEKREGEAMEIDGLMKGVTLLKGQGGVIPVPVNGETWALQRAAKVAFCHGFVAAMSLPRTYIASYEMRAKAQAEKAKAKRPVLGPDGNTVGGPVPGIDTPATEGE